MAPGLTSKDKGFGFIRGVGSADGAGVEVAVDIGAEVLELSDRVHVFSNVSLAWFMAN